MNDVERLIRVVSSARQKKWQELEFYGFIHYGLNTYIGVEWSDGNTPLAFLQPTDLDVEQWVISMKAAEMKGIIMFCKHHDGFCLWNTKTTKYNIMNTAYHKDLIQEVSACCQAHGMKFGIYLSPWDQTHPTYGTEAYNDTFIQQLGELLSNYGEIFSVWFDGACGEGKNGKKQPYDWERYYAFIREKMPNAVISVAGPDVRWCGNEAGWARPEEWSVVPKRLQQAETVSALSQQENSPDFRLKKINSRLMDLGSREMLADEEELAWYPCEVDTSIRPGWFYMPHDDDRVRPLDELLDIYLTTVGNNSSLLLNVPPSREGYFKKNDVKRLNEIGCFIRDTFGESLAADAEFSANDTAEGCSIEAVRTPSEDTYWRAASGKESAVIDIKLPAPTEVNYLTLMEDIAQSQRIEKFYLETVNGEEAVTIYQGTAVGHKKICRFPTVVTSHLRVTITQSRSSPTLRYLGVHHGYAVPSVQSRHHISQQ